MHLLLFIYIMRTRDCFSLEKRSAHSATFLLTKEGTKENALSVRRRLTHRQTLKKVWINTGAWLISVTSTDKSDP